jgi:CheY-like chemotaxis protein
MKKNILIVDDDADVRLTIKDVFEHKGHEVYCAQDGVECLKLLEKGFTGILFIDLQIPSMDGWTTIKEIVKRKLEKTSISSLSLRSAPPVIKK